MIYLTKRTGDRERFVYNCDLIEQVKESINGTLITTKDGNLIMVEESLDEIIKATQDYRAGILLIVEKKKEEGTCS